uniref:TraG conjugation protein n=1 Tax=Lactococcus lactis subsp. cremoris TaxID=1359 RepID=I6SK01_LACLC|nr:TraG conjugation protein [Lactococcus cremoris]
MIKMNYLSASLFILGYILSLWRLTYYFFYYKRVRQILQLMNVFSQVLIILLMRPHTPKTNEEYVYSHKDAYLLSSLAGGFNTVCLYYSIDGSKWVLLYKSIGDVILGRAHYMAGVKTSIKEDYPVTLATFISDSVDLTGTKAGTNVGDGTGGGYAWFKDYNAGIVGKAEFMAHQSLYRGAINNTDGKATLMAIANGGWATDPNYLISLLGAYNSIGQKYQWIDREAIEKHGEKPYQSNQLLDKKAIPNMPTKEEASQGLSEEGCVVNQTPSKEATGTNSAPTLTPPKEYEGKLKLPAPDNKNYAGNNYPFGQCTWGVFNRMAQLGTPIEWFSGNGGNGGFWWQSAKEKGYNVVKGNPKVGWAVSFTGGLAGSDPQYGHIAVVEFVNDDGSFLVSETNVVSPSSGTRSWRVINKATAQQAYFIQGRK